MRRGVFSKKIFGSDRQNENIMLENLTDRLDTLIKNLKQVLKTENDILNLKLT
jgi:hypothetical protein